jgi:zinc transport system substrate-binding protein
MCRNLPPGISLAAALLVGSLLVACDTKTTAQGEQTVGKRAYTADSPARVLTVNYPLQYFAQRIGGEFIAARYPGPADEDPAYWKPAVDTVIEYQQADLIILSGAGYASWVRQVSLPLAKQVDASAEFSDRLLPVNDNVAHMHGPQGEHVHDDLAGTVWLDPELAVLQAIAIHAALVPLFPEQAGSLNAKLATLTADLQDLDAQLSRVVATRGNRALVYSHPVYQYLDLRFGLNGVSVHWEPDEMPADEEFARLELMSGALMLWEAEPLPEIRARLDAMGIASVVFSIAATQPESGDYLEVMRANLQLLHSALP